jgi:molybdopterin adenylyltransferase
VSVDEHRSASPPANALRLAVLTVSDTRTLETDEGGRLAAQLAVAAGFVVAAAEIIPDDEPRIAARVRELAASGTVDAVLLTGGTGLSPRDRTVEAVTPLFDKTLPGYGELFRALSYAEIGPAAMLSRAVAGTVAAVALFTIPGSPAGVRLALEKLILPELTHVIGQLRRSGAHSHQHRHGHGHHSR